MERLHSRTERIIHPEFRRVLGERGLRLNKGQFWHWGPNKTVDVVLFAEESNDVVQLIRRQDNELLALPGGFVDYTDNGWEAPITAALRETMEEINLALEPEQLTQFYDGPVRDHRETLLAWPHTTAFVGRIALASHTVAGDDACKGSAGWHDVANLNPQLLHGSHHQLIIAGRQALSEC